MTTLLRRSLLLALVAALVVVAPASRASVVSAGAPSAPRVLATTPADLSPEAFAAHLSGNVSVRVHVAPEGIADSVLAVSGDPRLRASAEAAARWYVFESSPAGAWLVLVVDVKRADDDDPLSPDMPTEAHAAEQAGDLRGALDWWVGALNRIGTHACLRNEWAVREQTLRLARQMRPEPPIPSATFGAGQGLSAQLERVVARNLHLDVIAALHGPLLEAPWWPELYRCLAAAQCGSGQVVEARRTLRFYALGADSAGRVRAMGALRMLASADTIRAVEACELLKKQPTRPETEPGD